MIFEVMVGASAFGALIGMLTLNGLPCWHHPLFDSENFSRAMDDGFFLFVGAGDKRFDEALTYEFLSKIGGRSIETVRK